MVSSEIEKLECFKLPERTSRALFTRPCVGILLQVICFIGLRDLDKFNMLCIHVGYCLII